MHVRFWGTRGSIAKAGAETVRYGGNTSCVEIRSNDGTLIVLDCGTGAHGLGQALVGGGQRPLVGHLLFTHTHWDHIQGFPFFAPLFVPGNEWHIYGPRGVGPSLQESLSGQMQYTYFPITLSALGATLHYHDLVEGTLTIGGVHVTAQYLHHPALTLGYRLQADGVAVVYATDHEPHSSQGAAGDRNGLAREDKRHIRFLANADLLVHDAQYTAEEYPARVGWGHSTVEYVVDVAAAAGVRRLALFHHDPTRDDDAMDRMVSAARTRAHAVGVPLEVFGAAEGQSLELTAAADAPAASPARAPGETARFDVALAPSARRVVVGVPDPRQAQAIAAALGADEVQMLTGSDGPAILAHSSTHPSAIILAHEFPDLLGVVRAVRERSVGLAADVPVVVVRQAEHAAEQEEEIAAGVTDFLRWPCSVEYIRTRVRAWLLREACRWRAAPLPSDEMPRLDALRRTGLLDSPAEERFDRLTRIAAALFDVPIALVTLVDQDRQWFKSRVGVDETETARETAFCAHAILSEAVMQVPDALRDDRFADNPEVAGGIRVRFYAGAPLTLGNGTRAGTLCVIDRRARHLDERQLGLLEDLAKLAERELQRPAATTSPA